MMADIALALTLASAANQPTGNPDHDEKLAFVQEYAKDRAAARRAVSASVCHWKHVEQAWRSDLRDLYQQARQGIVVTSDEVGELRLFIGNAHASMLNTVKLLPSVGVSAPPLACTPELTHLGNCIDGYGEECTTGTYEEAQRFVQALRELVGCEVMAP